MQLARKYANVIGILSMLLLLVIALAMSGREARAGGGGGAVVPVDTSFSYQGYLEEDGSPVDGTCDFQFGLFDSPTGGLQYGDVNEETLSVDRGVFSTTLDFGHQFAARKHWLAVAVRCPSGSGSFTTLSPRSEVNGAPLAQALPSVSIIPQGVGEGAGYEDVNVSVKGGLWAKNLIMSYSSVSVNDGSFVSPRAFMRLGQAGVGNVVTAGNNNSTNVWLDALNGEPNHGWLGVYDADGQSRTRLTVLGSGEGYVSTLGPNGNRNAAISALNGYPNNGWVAVQDEDGNSQAGMYVNSAGQGIIFADNLTFASASTARANTEIWYSVLEGPEPAAYLRGTAELIDGEATIKLPGHFLEKATIEAITVQVTPLSAESLGLAVVEKSSEGIKVQELQGGTGTYEFDFFITSTRKGYEDYEVLRSMSDPSSISRSTPAIIETDRDTHNAADAVGELEK